MTRLYGKGTIAEIIKGKKYRIALSGGKDPVTGKYRRHQETFIGTKRQAELRIEQIRREMEQGKVPNADKVTFAEWCERYLSTREALGKQRASTLKRDRTTSKHLLDRLGAAQVVDITPAVIEGAYAAMRSDGLGDATLKHCHRLLKCILKNAVDNDIIMRNPCDRVEAPRKPKSNRNALTPDETRHLVTVATDGTPDAHRMAVYLGIATGARLGEVLGLTWENVHLDAKRPYVNLIQQYTADGKIGPLKTDADDNPVGRIVPLDASAVAVLRAWRAEQRRNLLVVGIEQGTSTPVVADAVGGFMNHANYERWFRLFCVKNGFGKHVSEDGREIITLAVGEDPSRYPDAVIEFQDLEGWPCDETGKRYSRTYKRPKVRRKYTGLRFHELRHTHFTMRLADGMDIPTAQALGGWSSPQMLMTTYAHPVMDNVWASAGFMDRLTVGGR